MDMFSRRPGLALHFGLILLIFALSACFGGGSSSSGTSGTSPQSEITISGSIPASSVAQSLGQQNTSLFSWLLEAIFAPRAYAAGEGIDTVLAITPASGVTVGTVNPDGTFSINLVAGYTYLLAFYQGTVFRLAYAYSIEGLDSLPLVNVTTDLSLGSLEVNGIRLEPSSDPAVLLNLTEEERDIIAQFDEALWRYANADVDGDGTFDFEQNRKYDFGIRVNFNAQGGLAAIDNTFIDPDNYVPAGYNFFFPIEREDLPSDRITTGADDSAYGGPVARFIPPSPFTTMANGNAPVVGDDEDCWQPSWEGNSTRSYYYNFHCGGTAIVEPVWMPEGTYSIQLYNGSRTERSLGGLDGTATMVPYTGTESGEGTWAINYSFPHTPVISVGGTRDAPRIAVRANVVAGQLQSVSYQWKRYETASAAWVDMTDQEVVLYVDSSSYENGAASVEFSTNSGSTRGYFPGEGVRASGTLSDLRDEAGNPVSPDAFPPFLAFDWLVVTYIDFTGLIFFYDIR